MHNLMSENGHNSQLSSAFHNDKTSPDFHASPTKSLEPVLADSTRAETIREESPPIVSRSLAHQVWPPIQQTYRVYDSTTPALMIVLLVLALLLIVSGLGLITYTTARQYSSSIHTSATVDARATQYVLSTARAQQFQDQSTAQAVATNQVNIDATATTQTNATATAAIGIDSVTATATALGDLYTKSTSGKSQLDNPLSNNAGQGQWDEGNDSAGTGCMFTNGKYVVSQSQQGYFQPCVAQNTEFKNFVYQVQMTITKGSHGQAGLLFRIDNMIKAYYFFHIGIDGSYALDVYKSNGQAATVTQGFNADIAAGFDKTNEIAVIAQGESYYLFVNGHYINTVTDPSLKTGKIGIAVIDNGAPIQAEFSDAQVWKL